MEGETQMRKAIETPRHIITVCLYEDEGLVDLGRVCGGGGGFGVVFERFGVGGEEGVDGWRGLGLVVRWGEGSG